MKTSDLLFFTALNLGFPACLAAQPNIGSFNIYYGGLHNHTDVSDGLGTPAAAYNHAKNIGFLDFFGLSDHSGSIDDTEWAATKAAADLYNEPGRFTTFRGFEWTSFTYGHVNVVNSDNYFDTYTFTELCDWINNNECIATFNHPGAVDAEGTEFNHFLSSPSLKFIGMELSNGTKDYRSYYYTDGYFQGDGNKGYFDEALSRNWKIGAISSEDNHIGTWGLLNDYRMAILANANTREDLYAALKARRFYSTLDKNLALSFKIDGKEMGSTVATGSHGVRIQASDGNGELFTRVQLIKNGAIINTWSPNAAKPDINTTLVFANNEYYYVKIQQADGDEAISSPIWISGGNLAPAITFTSPQHGAVYTAPATVTLAATASDPDGTVARVEFYYGNILLVTDNTLPYSYTGTNVPVGSYTLSAKATDNSGASVMSPPVTITVTDSNLPPVVSFTSPAPGSTYTAPATITLLASASDPDGSVAKVEFYHLGNLLYSDYTPPYSFTGTSVPAGNYVLNAKATDNKGATTISPGILLTVSSLKSAYLAESHIYSKTDPPFTSLIPPSGKVVCYPVPFTNQLNVNLVEYAGENITGIEIFNTAGRLISSNSYNSRQVVMNLENFNSGVYLLRVRSTKGIYQKTIVKN